MTAERTLELPILGMDCAECTRRVQSAIAALPGVASVEIFLAAEKAVISLDAEQTSLADIRAAVRSAGYEVPDTAEERSAANARHVANHVLTLVALVFGAVLFVVIAGEWLGLFERLAERIPWYAGLALVLAGGYPVFLNVIRAALNRRVISHTLMTLGVIAALAVGQWITAAVVVFFMRVGDYVEGFTTSRARRAVKELSKLAPQTARVERGEDVIEVPADQVTPGEVVVVRPGEKVPVDGVVLSGQAVVDQAAITGESLPVDAGPGSRIYAAGLVSQGSLRLRTEHAGADTTFARVIRLVEEAEGQRGTVQRFADRFSAWYLPVVAGIAALTFLLRRDPLAAAAVLVVACSCSFTLATPIALLASIGAAARRGLLIKGGRVLETLARADVLLVDKTGTLTLGRPQITDILVLDRRPQDEFLALVAAAERYSEHPLAEAVRRIARERGLLLPGAEQFKAMPGLGVEALVAGRRVVVGNRKLAGPDEPLLQAEALEAQGKTLLFVRVDNELAGVLAAADTLRLEVPAALAEVRRLGILKLELLTGDNETTARDLAGRLGVDYHADLLPEDKIAVVKAYQAGGHTVVMVGDGVNDAPALAQADVGIAMGAAGSDVAIEAAHLALMRDDWRLVPTALRMARRTMRVVKMNIAFTALYNMAGLGLAALGFLPPVLAAAAQSLPDLGILANSARLLRQKDGFQL
jgi:Cu+-exporting ATPase